MSGEFDSRKDSQSTICERRPQIFIKPFDANGILFSFFLFIFLTFIDRPIPKNLHRQQEANVKNIEDKMRLTNLYQSYFPNFRSHEHQKQ